jgi:competence protein ComEC
MPRTGWLAAGAAAASFLSGSAAAASPVALPGLVVAMASMALAAVLLLRGRDGRSCIAMAIGALAIAIRLGISPPAAAPASLPEGTGPWHAVVESVGAPRPGQQQATLRLDAPLGLRLAATLPSYPLVAPGTALVLTGRLEAPRDDDYGAFLRRTGVAGTLRADSLALDPQAGTGATISLETLRRGAADAMATVLPEPAAGLAAGILIGLRDRVDRGLAADFTTAGVSHVVAISGWNIAIVGAVVGGLLSRARRRRRALAILVAVVAYTAFAGASPSVLRAAAMAAVVLLARESGRAGRAGAALGAATALLLLADPGLVVDAGMQLSVLATAGLLVWAAPIRARIEHLGPVHLPDWLAESLSLSTAAQLATLPVILATFGRLSLVAPLANLAVAPVVPVTMAGGLLALAGGTLAAAGVPPALAAVIAVPGWIALGLLIRIVRVAAAVPFASVDLTPPFDTLSGVVAGLVALALVPSVQAGLRRLGPRLGHRSPRSRDGRPTLAVKDRLGIGAARSGRAAGSRAPSRLARLAVAGLAAAVALTVLAASSRPDGRVRVTILDVGQGDAILVEGERGGRLLVDGGPDGPTLLAALDERIPPWDRRIDMVVLTHPHEDHVGGLPALFGRYRIGRAFENGMEGPGPAYEAWRDAAARCGVRIGVLGTGDTIGIDSVTLRVLWPDRGSVPLEPADTGSGINDSSIVLLGEIGPARFLLTGDAEETVDPVLVGRGLPTVDLLKVAHHGSRTASSAPLLDAIRPAVAIISVGAANEYGHPAPSTLARLEERRARVLRTDLDGTVVASLDGRAWTVTTARHPTSRPTPAAAALGPGPLGYHPVDARTRPRRRRLRPAVARSVALVRPPRTRRGRGRQLAGFEGRPPRAGHRPSGRRGRGPPPRCGQGAPTDRSDPPTAPWRGLGGLVDRAWSSGARAARGSTSRHPARRSGCGRLARGRAAGGTPRRLCRQAGGSASRADGGAIRGLGAALPTRGEARLGRGDGGAGPRAGATTRARRLRSPGHRAG